MNIAVIGAGGVGGYFGGKLTQLLKDQKDLNIFFIARGIHLDEIKKNGLILDSDEGQMICVPTSADDNISQLPQLDLCLICVKSYDLENVLTQLKSKIKDKAMILPLLNGVDIYDRIRTIIKNGVVFPSCVYVGTHIEKPGKVTQRGGSCTIHFGKDPNNDYIDPEIFELLQKAKIKYNWLDDPYKEIWSKFIFIASFGMVTANYNKTLGEVMESEELSGYVEDIMNEIYQIALKKNISLPETIVNDSYMKGAKFPFETKTSFQRDYENRAKSDERDLFGGAIIRLGEQFGIKTEAAKSIYCSLEKNRIIE
ncbi:MAG: 2-dehydropantoate 2-reductase [Spirochaetes bacterium]|nr:2-dehydropantoate 2-reductase [Spirochaetota bacterium]